MRRKIIGTIAISSALLFTGCASSSNNGASLKGSGVVNTVEKNQRIAKLIKSRDNVKSVFNQILRAQKGDKYESTAEYKNRMDNLKINRYAVIDLKTEKAYNPNTKMYQIKFSLDKGSLGGGYSRRYYKGQLTKMSYLGPSNESYYFSKRASGSSYHDRQSNAYGVTVGVDTYTSTSYEAHFFNINKLIGMPNIKAYRTEVYSTSYAIFIQMDKEKAKQLDKQKIKAKARVLFINTAHGLFKDIVGSGATIDTPVALYGTMYQFEAQLKELVVYSQNTKEILFKFAD